jgi:hypothetical protein
MRKELESIEHGFLFHKSHAGNLAPFAKSDFSLAMVIQSDTLLRLFRFLVPLEVHFCSKKDRNF